MFELDKYPEMQSLAIQISLGIQTECALSQMFIVYTRNIYRYQEYDTMPLKITFR